MIVSNEPNPGNFTQDICLQLLSIDSSADNDSAYIHCILDSMFTKVELASSSCGGRRSNSSGKQHTPLNRTKLDAARCKFARFNIRSIISIEFSLHFYTIHYSGLFTNRVNNDKARLKHFTKAVNKKCNYHRRLIVKNNTEENKETL